MIATISQYAIDLCGLLGGDTGDLHEVLGGGEELGLVAARRGEEIVELLEDLLGLTLGVRGGVGGDLAGDVDGVAVDDGGAQTLAGLYPLDGHQDLLGLA